MADKLSSQEKKEVREEIKKAAVQRAREKAEELRNEYKRQVSTAIITAFGLVIALVWKDVVTALIPSISIPDLFERYPLLVSLYNALIVTALAVIGILIISKWGKPKDVPVK